MGLLITLLIALLFFVLVFYVIDKIGLDAPTNKIVKAILAIVFLIWLLDNFWWHVGGWYLR